MPELPEVETIRRGLSKFIVKKRLTRTGILCEKSFIGTPVSGAVKELRRYGKALVVDLEGGWSLMVHLRMTGQLIFRSFIDNGPILASADALSGQHKVPSGSPASLNLNHSEQNFAGGHPSENFVAALPNKQTRVVLEFENGTLYFNDQRKFGFIKALKTDEVENDEFIRKLAPEPWVMAAGELYERLQRHKNSLIKAAILDQTLICGLGNIYADEALFAAGVHPERRAGSLSRAEVEHLLAAACEVMDRSIASGGSTMATYVKADGTRGDYLEKFAQVFRREGQACPRCGGEIVKIRVAGRGTHICPRCQRLEGACAGCGRGGSGACEIADNGGGRE